MPYLMSGSTIQPHTSMQIFTWTYNQLGLINLHGTPNSTGAAACPGARGGPVRVHAPRVCHQQQVQGHREELVDRPGREGECGLLISRPASLRRRSKRDPRRGRAHCQCDICRVAATTSWVHAQLPISTAISGASQHL